MNLQIDQWSLFTVYMFNFSARITFIIILRMCCPGLTAYRECEYNSITKRAEVQMMERTFVMLKPDAVRRKLVGEIIRRLEMRGLEIVELRLLRPTRELAKKHYAAHADKPFFDPLIEYITSGPVVAMIVEANDVVRLVRNTMGAIKPADAAPGTIRGDLTTDMRQNLIHGADSIESAEMEIALWFPEVANTSS